MPSLLPVAAAIVVVLAALALPAGSALAQSAPLPKPAYKVNPPTCQNTASFDRWLEDFRKEAAAKGIKPATIASVLSGQMFDGSIIARDRRQGFFSQSFLESSDKLISKNRLATGPNNMKKHAGTFVRAEQQWGVPAAVLTAFWALESDFGSGMGKLPVLRSLASLAYDCRRGAMFRAELTDALRIIDRGDLKASDMIGSWAGELGQTQFLPSHYFKHAVDFDGDGRRDLMRSAPDIIASSSAFILSARTRHTSASVGCSPKQNLPPPAAGKPLAEAEIRAVREWIDRGNFADSVALGLTPVTVCSDLLQPGGYARGGRYFDPLLAGMTELGARTIPEFVIRAFGLGAAGLTVLTGIDENLRTRCASALAGGGAPEIFLVGTMY